MLSFSGIEDEKSGQARQDALEREKDTLEVEEGVEAVEYNYVYELQGVTTEGVADGAPDDPLFDRQWGLQRVKAPQAWEKATGKGSIIAIIDGGALSTHEDLRGAVVDEWDYYAGDPVPTAKSGHATHVSGIAAARANNATGVAGVAPRSALFNYDVCGPNGCAGSAIAKAITDATDLGADVINLSLAGYRSSTLTRDAVNYAYNHGVVVVAAAGNNATNKPAYPAAYPNAIAVSATSYRNTRSDFSNYGDWVDVAAPGGNSDTTESRRILSSVPTSTDPSGYAAWNGTSMASPHVAGVAALLDSKGMSAYRIRHRIQSTATDLGSAGEDALFGHGLVNARAALENLADVTPPKGTIAINGGRAYTKSRSVNLTLKATDPDTASARASGVATTRVRNARGDWSSWQPYTAGKSWRLTAGAGQKTVYVQYKDHVGNLSTPARDSITYRP